MDRIAIVEQLFGVNMHTAMAAIAAIAAIGAIAYTAGAVESTSRRVSMAHGVWHMEYGTLSSRPRCACCFAVSNEIEKGTSLAK